MKEKLFIMKQKLPRTQSQANFKERHSIFRTVPHYPQELPRALWKTEQEKMCSTCLSTGTWYVVTHGVHINTAVAAVFRIRHESFKKPTKKGTLTFFKLCPELQNCNGHPAMLVMINT